MPAIQAPDVLNALIVHLNGMQSGARHRGEAYFRNRRVLRVTPSPDGLSLNAAVRGTHFYEVLLRYNEDAGLWGDDCSCPLGGGCKHVHAAGLAWLEKTLARADDAPRRVTFREHWAPFIAEKLGRPLAEPELKRLGALSSLFHEFRGNHSNLTHFMIANHGFPPVVDGAAAPSLFAYKPILCDFTAIQSPADPWALWQCLAVNYEDNGVEIPEVFRPKTDTASLRARLDEQTLQNEIQRWRNYFSPAQHPAASPVPAGLDGVLDLRVEINADGQFALRAQTRAGKPWKPVAQKWLRNLGTLAPAQLQTLPAPASALATALRFTPRLDGRYYYWDVENLGDSITGDILNYPPARAAIFLPDGSPWRIEPEPLACEYTAPEPAPGRPPSASRSLRLRLLTPEGRPVKRLVWLADCDIPDENSGPRGRDATATGLLLVDNRVYRAPAHLPSTLPIAALAHPEIISGLRKIGVSLPAGVIPKFQRVPMRPLLRCRLDGDYLFITLHARAKAPACVKDLSFARGWIQPENAPAAPVLDPEGNPYEFDTADADKIAAQLSALAFALVRDVYPGLATHGNPLTAAFLEKFSAWRESTGIPVDIEASPDAAELFGKPIRATLDFSAIPDPGQPRDWFDLNIKLTADDTTLTPADIALLMKSAGKWVRLPSRGWRRIEIAGDAGAAAFLDRLGLPVGDILAGRNTTARVHALQLAPEAGHLEKHHQALADALRERAATLTAAPPPALPKGLAATLRPYQVEGYHFLAHLSSQNLGGILADDMGLGKTVQTLAWLLHLSSREKPRRGGAPRHLVICPKSVVHGWLSETARFAPSLDAQAFTPALAAQEPSAGGPVPALLVANYAQLRLHAAWFLARQWDAVILDEAQFIKNPASKAAATARALRARHRLALTGTPVENRLLDLWSILAFAQPGLLGTQASFKRDYRQTSPQALALLRRRVRHFMLRRAKSQVATDLPPRTEDEILIDLDPAQRRLYDAELKRARALLLGVETGPALDKIRFNILSSLLRLRQICCHPALLGPAHAALPSEKLDALIERLDELRDEGHQVLVFSQFVTMLDLIASRLDDAKIPRLLLTGQTDDRAALIEKFQTDKTRTVFLLSLKAAGFGLNLTAATYAILYDPWWNPAVEAQAIDRAHRIGQTQPVVAYRLIAKNTIEEKIRALQRDKAALAAAIVQEESLASVLDLDSLRQILS